MMTGLPPQWLLALGTYLWVIGALNLIWEVLHLPLYAIWTTGTWGERAFAVVHCTGGDLLIALSSLVAALLVAWAADWPQQGFRRVAIVTIAIGLAYTAFSEWLNVYQRQSWAYSDWMPTIGLGGVRIGLSPLAQWLIVPTLTFLAIDMFVRRRLRSERREARASE